MNKIQSDITEVSLTSLSNTGGCSAKLAAGTLHRLLSKIPNPVDANLLTSFCCNEDAAVYKLSDDIAYISTVDVNTPAVDDPFIFGQIAASNALSDVYAMGGRPLTCLNIVGFPDELDTLILEKIVEGALSKIQEAGALLVGGHTIRDKQPWFGLSVTGLVHPNKFWKNSTAHVGDSLILTKPIGSGVIFSVNKLVGLEPTLLSPCIATTTALNKNAAEVLNEFDIHAVTDVTGFGLLGHVFEMIAPQKLSCSLIVDSIPMLEGAALWYEKGFSTSITQSNLNYLKPYLINRSLIKDHIVQLLADPQTNGGLLIAVDPKISKDVVNALKNKKIIHSAVIGNIEKRDNITIQV